MNSQGKPFPSFRFPVTQDTLALGYILPAVGRIRDFHPLKHAPAGRTINRETLHIGKVSLFLFFDFSLFAVALLCFPQNCFQQVSIKRRIRRIHLVKLRGLVCFLGEFSGIGGFRFLAHRLRHRAGCEIEIIRLIRCVGLFRLLGVLPLCRALLHRLLGILLHRALSGLLGILLYRALCRLLGVLLLKRTMLRRIGSSRSCGSGSGSTAQRAVGAAVVAVVSGANPFPGIGTWILRHCRLLRPW